MKTFVEFLKPVRKRLGGLTGQPDQLTLVFDAGASPDKIWKGWSAMRPRFVRPITGLCFPKLPDILPKCRCLTAPPFVPGEPNGRLPENSERW
jgi:hypothetical protein